MTELLGTFLLLSMLALMAARAAPPIAAPVNGTSLLDVPVRPIFRLLAQKFNVIAILAVLILGSGMVGERWISHGMFLFTLVAVAGLLVVPVRYRFTTGGVSPNRATFRAWREFDGWVYSGNVIHLNGRDRFGSLKLYVASQDQKDVLDVLRRYLPVEASGPAPQRPPARRASSRKLRQKGGMP
jgi:hypothetical protein